MRRIPSSPSTSIRYCTYLTVIRNALDQLQRFEDSAPDNLEFERLKEHFEPFIRASIASSSTSHHLRATHHTHSNPVTAAASDALSRDVPGVSKYNPLSRSRVGRDKQNRDEMPEYRSRMDVSLAGNDGANVEHLLGIESPDEIVALDQKWINSWTSSVLVRSASIDGTPGRTIVNFLPFSTAI